MYEFHSNTKPRPYLDNCLKQLLKVLGWKGDDAFLFEAMPHMVSIDNIDKFIHVMENVGYLTKVISIKCDDISEKNYPCLFLSSDGAAPIVILKKIPEGLLVFDSETKSTITMPISERLGIALYFKQTKEELVKEDHQNWVNEVIYNCKGMISILFLISFLQAILYLVPAAYVMFLYDNVINTSSYRMLFSFSLAMGFALYSLYVLTNFKSRILGFFGARLQNNIGVVIFTRLLKLQAMHVESASLSRQLLRINDFNQLREFFGGPLFSTVFELPFVFIFLFFIWYFGGLTVLAPVIGIFVFFAVAFLIWFFGKRYIGKNALIRGKFQDFLLETFSGMRSLQFSGLQKMWLVKFKEICASSTLYGKDSLLINSINESVFDALTLLIGFFTLIAGSILIMHEQIAIGGLIAILFIIWRVLAPIKTLSVMFPKLVQIKRSVTQLNELMRFPIEISNEFLWENMPSKITGEVQFDQVAFRYPGADMLVLKNVSFSIKQGESVLILGPTASGKTTIVNLLLNLYPIQGGHIFIDHRNIRQFDVHFLRKNIALVPQRAELFYGTIAQNLRLVAPLVRDQDLEDALKAANLWNEIMQLDDGLETRIRFYGDYRFGPSFCQKMNLARAYVKNAPILLMDEPTNSLDDNSIAVFSEQIKNIKGIKTVIIVDHDIKHAHLVDRIIVLKDGITVASGTPDQILKNAPKGMG